MGRKRKEDVEYEEDIFKVDDDVMEHNDEDYIDLDTLMNEEVAGTSVGDIINRLHKDDLIELGTIVKKALDRLK